VVPPIYNSRIASLQREKNKKGARTWGNQRRANTARLEETMKRKKRKRKQQSCDVAEVIDTPAGRFKGKEGLSGYRASC
jgi:hypothetical protein